MRSDLAAGGNTGLPPSNAFMPVQSCWMCVVIDAVTRAAWRGEDGLTLRDWLSVTASGMWHLMNDHDLHPTVAAPHSTRR